MPEPGRPELVLAIDTSTACTVAGLASDGRVLGAFAHLDPMRHGEVLTPGIAAMLATTGVDRAELTRIVVGVGPGPYTGLRVGLVTAVVLGDALGIGVDGVDSLDALSLGVTPASFASGPVVVAADARRREVYWARYSGPGRSLDAPAVGPATDAAAAGRPGEIAVGAGAARYPEAFAAVEPPEYPDGGLLAAAASQGRMTRTEPRPHYLRRPDATPVDPSGSTRKPATPQARR